MTAASASPDAPAPPRCLGAFLGVYTPTVLTILGVIMYLRMGWVVGEVGLPRALLVVVLANAITLVTTLSFSAVATNIRVGVGGAYFIISRSLGLEIGGAVGVPLFLSQMLSVTLYSFGLAEALRLAWPGVNVEAAAFFIVIAVATLARFGAGLALRAQIPLMVLIAVSVVALAVGALTGDPVHSEEAARDAAAPIGFFAVFAVFFPAVTGIMVGLGLSGDLVDPGRAIPRGAISAVITGFAVYLIVPCLLAIGATPAALRSDSMVWTRIAPLGAVLVLPGLFGAIFSSAVGSILGAPRTLQALAMDQLAPARLGRLAGRVGEPLLGLLVTTAVALAAVFLGDLNAVAPVVSMFFLTIYGTINVVAALETLAGDPSWRPRFRLPWPVSLAGGIACFAVMFLISAPAAIVAILVEVLLWLFLARKERRADWGDARRGAYESLIRWCLLRLSRRPQSARNWRPHVLVFAGDLERRIDLVRFGSWFSQGRGIVSVCDLLTGDLDTDAGLLEERQERMRERLVEAGILAFPETSMVRSVTTGIPAVAQANGIAGLESNTILLGWPQEEERLAEFLEVVRLLQRIHKSSVIGKIAPDAVPRRGEWREIDLWWGGLQRNGDLMLLLAWLLTRNPEWRRAKLRLLSVATDEEARDRRERDLARLLEEIRIPAEPRVIVEAGERSVREVIQFESAAADVVFLGMNVPGPGEELDYARQLRPLAEGLETVLFVKNASTFGGELI